MNIKNLLEMDMGEAIDWLIDNSNTYKLVKNEAKELPCPQCNALNETLEKKFMTGQEKIDLMKKLDCPDIGSVVGRNEMVLCEEINRLRECVKDLDRLVHDQVVVMQSALIEASHNGHQAGLKWIYNELWGPGPLPDENDKWFYDASLYYCAHKTDPMGPCEICGIPSSRLRMKHVACCGEHLKEALQKAGL